MKKPYQGLLYTLVSALVPILPEHVYGSGKIQTNPANSKPVGSGPFKFVEWKTGDYIILERHEKFYRAPARLDRLILKILEDPLTRVLALEKGTIDYYPFPFIHFTDVIRLQKNSNLRVTKNGYEAMGPTNYININLRNAPLDDLRVRQALAHAIDKDFIVNKLHHGLSRREDGPLYHASPFFDQGALKIYKYDLGAANQLLEAAGHPKKGDGTRMQLTLDVPPFHPDSMQLVAQYLKSQLRKVGIDIVLRPSTDLADWANRIGNWDYQLSMDATWNYPDPPIGVDRVYVCSNIRKQIWTNTEGYCNEQVDKWLSAAIAEGDFEKRKKLYGQFQKQVTEDLPLIWTNEEPYTTIYKADLKNVPGGVWGAVAPLDEVTRA
jgi:peptide/nickel transport system substrate-binding protein